MLQTASVWNTQRPQPINSGYDDWPDRAFGLALYLLRYGANRRTRFESFLLLTVTILENNRLVRLGVLRRKWPLPLTVRTIFPVLVWRNRLAVALCVLSLYLPLRPTVMLLRDSPADDVQSAG